MRRFSHFLIPDLVCESVYDIPEEYLIKRGIKVLLFDIDNTLAPYDAPEPDEKLKTFLFGLREKGYGIALVSNNTSERVERFNRTLGFFTVSDVHKPKKSSLFKALEHFAGVRKKHIAFVGDQLLTDAVAARRNGVRTIIVHPIKKKENLFFRFKRAIEKPFMSAYFRIKERRKKRKENRS